MAVLRVNAAPDGGLAAPGGAGAWDAALGGLCAALPPGAPVAVLIHGFRFSPDCAQERLYRTGPVAPCGRRRPRLAAWPHALGFSEGDPADGLAVAFGWSARTFLHDFASAYRAASRAGAALAEAVARLRALLPGRRIDVFAHSLGARVALEAMRRLPPGSLGRLIFLGAAEFAGAARSALGAAGGAEIYNVISRRNDLYDSLFETFAPRPGNPGDRPLGVAGLAAPPEGWLDLQIDHPATERWLARRGIALDPGPWRISHWSFYADPGAMALYASILRDRAGAWSVAALRQAGLPAEIEPRWARIAPRLRPAPRRQAAADPVADPIAAGEFGLPV